MPPIRPWEGLRRLGANAQSGLRGGLARAMLSRGRPTWLRVRLETDVPELRGPSLALALGRPGPSQSLLELLQTLETAARDPDLTGIVLRLGGAPGGLARALAVRRAVEAAAVHKPVVAWGDRLSLVDYLVGSAARELWVPPSGGIDLVGFRLEGWFLRDLLERVGVSPEVLRVGSFKTAAETLTRSAMSPEQREQLESLADDWYEALVEAIARGREREPDAVRAWIDAGPHGAAEACAQGWIDHCRYADEAEDELVRRSPGAGSVEDLRVVDAATYHGLRAGNPGWRPLLGDLPRIGYVVASGVVRRGRGFRGVASETFRGALTRLRRDEGVRGVVLRVESPGGDGLASDLLWRELRVLRDAKPLVVSLGDVAASGGYYLAAAGHEVLAEPGTVTGSIGVVGGKLDASGLYERLGVSRDAVERGARAGIHSETRGFTPEERSHLRHEMEALYERFLDRVEAGRGLPRAELERHAQGRVWSGARALGLGLVDALGGPLEALAAVRRRAGLTPDERVLVEVHPRLPRFAGLWSFAGRGGTASGIF